MLEKMGWSKGKGLGANLDGSLNFIKVAHKDNQKGMGFKDRDDQWTQHEDNFNALLKSFETETGGGGSSDCKDDAEDSSGESSGRVGFGFKSAEPKPTKESVFSGMSLEEQSKKSRSRVHYKKFTRGKDMARYSEQDLANIFGKRSLGDKNAYAAQAEEETISKEQVEETQTVTEEKTFGVTVIKTGLSVTDYFKAKMDAMRANRSGADGAKSSNPFYVCQPEKVTLNFSKEDFIDTRVEVVSSSMKNNEGKRKLGAVEQEESQVEVSLESLKKVKKSKKKAKHSNGVVEVDDIIDISKEHPSDVLITLENVLKKKKSKLSQEELIETSLDQPTEPSVLEQDVPKRKKSKKKSKRIEEDAQLVENNSATDVPEQKKSKKKSNRTDTGVLVSAEINQVLSEEGQDLTSATPIKKKKNKRKTAENEECTTVEVPIKKSKKCKKNKFTDVANEPVQSADNATPESSSSSAKKLREVIKTQPMHFPKIVSNLLTSLYDPKIVEVCQSELETIQPTPNSTKTPAINAAATQLPSTTILGETFELAKFKAEVFRFFDLGAFPDSNLGDVAGYGYSRNLQLKVTTHLQDDARITDFWDLALINKYGSDAIKIKKVAKKRKYNIKALEKKNVFKF